MTQRPFNPLLLEMVGSAAICALAYAAETLIGAMRRRRS
jgi:hypothetical protein